MSLDCLHRIPVQIYGMRIVPIGPMKAQYHFRNNMMIAKLENETIAGTILTGGEGGIV